jgi:antitoxin component of MazEF toxin-antitoxin module
LNIQEFALTVDKNSHLKIPNRLIKEMGLSPKDRIRVAFIAEDGKNRYHEFLLTAENEENADHLEHVALPESLLEKAGIPSKADVQIFCVSGAIIICEDPILNMGELKEVLKSVCVATDFLDEWISERSEL